MKYRWMALLLIPAAMLLWPGAISQAQTVPTPNATVVAMQTQAAGLESQLPVLRATDQAARDAAARALAVANQSSSAVQQTQANIDQSHAAINAGLGQQALELAGRSQDSLVAAQATLTSQIQNIDRAVSDLGQASAAYHAAAPAIVATAQAVVASAGQVTQQVQIRAEDQIRQQADRYQSERTAERVAFGLVLLITAIVSYRLSARSRAVTPTSAEPAQLSDRERLPGQPVEFVEDEGLGDYFSQSDHS
jgi:uncharacterized protein YccT (UPF0319 family)